eukprot:6483191-Amphidinium_carterae.1
MAGWSRLMNASEALATVVLQSVHIASTSHYNLGMNTNIQHQLHNDTTNYTNYDHDYQFHTTCLIQIAVINTM